jgi:hypothetical protein
MHTCTSGWIEFIHVLTFVVKAIFYVAQLNVLWRNPTIYVCLVSDVDWFGSIKYYDVI